MDTSELQFTSDSKIEELDLCKSHLSTLPPSIGKLQHLRKLYLDCNELTTLPFSICHCTNLNYVSLTFNKISFFPGVLLSMNSLRDIRRHSNPTDYSISMLVSARFSNYIRQVTVNDVSSKYGTNRDEVPSLKMMAIQKALSANITQQYWRNKNIPHMLIRQLDNAQLCHRVCECCHSTIHNESSHNGNSMISCIVFLQCIAIASCYTYIASYIASSYCLDFIGYCQQFHCMA